MTANAEIEKARIEMFFDADWRATLTPATLEHCAPTLEDILDARARDVL